jgi:hypothetical protein
MKFQSITIDLNLELVEIFNRLKHVNKIYFCNSRTTRCDPRGHKGKGNVSQRQGAWLSWAWAMSQLRALGSVDVQGHCLAEAGRMAVVGVGYVATAYRGQCG